MASVWLLRGEDAPQAQGAARPPFFLSVSLGSVEVGELAPHSRIAGEVRAQQHAKLSFERSGSLLKLHLEEGMPVEAGTCLAELDPREAQLDVDSAKAQLQLAQSELAKALAGVREEERARLKAEAVALGAELDKAKLEADRAESLLEGGVSSMAERDRRSAELRTAKARLEAAEHRLREAQAGTRVEDIESRRAQVAHAQSLLGTAQLELERCRLTAPFAGQLVRRWRSVGDRVAPADPVFELVGTRAREVVADLPHSLSLQLERGSAVLLREPRSRVAVPARLDELAATLDSGTRNARAWVRLPEDADRRLAPGVAVEIEFSWKPLQGVLLVPSDSVRRTDQGTIVVVADPAPTPGGAPFVARLVPVNVLGSGDGKSAVESLGGELKTGMQVVVIGVEMAFPQAPLMPRTEAKQP
jgi:RND family efflux transporter MFP subunit